MGVFKVLWPTVGGFVVAVLFSITFDGWISDVSKFLNYETPVQIDYFYQEFKREGCVFVKNIASDKKSLKDGIVCLKFEAATKIDSCALYIDSLLCSVGSEGIQTSINLDYYFALPGPLNYGESCYLLIHFSGHSYANVFDGAQVCIKGKGVNVCSIDQSLTINRYQSFLKIYNIITISLILIICVFFSIFVSYR